MSSSLAVLRNCGDHVEAEAIRIRLAAAGIRAMVTGTDMATALSLGGAGTMRMVRVEVPVEDAERANALLEEDRRRAAEAGPWICGRCHEQNEATFEVCWSCSKPRDDGDERGRLQSDSPQGDSFPKSTDDQLPAPGVEDRNPYRPPITASQKTPPPPFAVELEDELHEEVKRAVRAAIIGVFVFPPLVSFYSLLLLQSLDRRVYRDSRLRRRVIIAWIVNLVMIPCWTIFWLGQYV